MDCGVFRRAALLEAGHTEVSLRRALRDGSLTKVCTGWYATANADKAVVSAVQQGGALTCVSALEKHGLWVPPGARRRLHLRPTRHREQRRHCCAYGGPYPVETAVDDIDIALLCAAKCVPGEQWIAIADSVLRKKCLTVDDLRRQLPCVPPAVDRLISQCDAKSQSGTESIARVRLRGAGYKVVVQPDVKSYGGHADLRIGRLLIECDSVGFHTDLEAYRYDRYRDRKSLVDGWMTLRLTYEDVMFGWPEALADIRAITRAERHRFPRDRRA
ncbi:endonuclease domain-containing protein [Gordonia sp. (in: high G+C Gram-positive bacteria)]|uniref:endonuclease domain-containing protein n=1 Tax=Gordonia sp. (in: high G+C Gram-positive bacteria) TaxID=84139 RepID=UPI0039E6B1B4